jgi:transposase
MSMLAYAAEHGMSAAAREFGVSRSWLYELRKRYERHGDAGLELRAGPERRDPRRLAPEIESAIVAYAIEHPSAGPRRIAASLQLEPGGGLRVSHGAVSKVLARHGLSQRAERIAAHEREDAPPPR